MKPTTSITPSQLVGRRIRDARGVQGIPQVELGRRLKAWIGGDGWSKQTVSHAEQGRRDFTAAELLALSACLDQPLGYFFSVPPDADEVLQFPAPRKKIPIQNTLAIVYGLRSATKLDAEAQMMVLRIADEVRATVERIGRETLHAEQGAELLVQLAQGFPAIEEAERALSRRPQPRPTKKGQRSGKQA